MCDGSFAQISINQNETRLLSLCLSVLLLQVGDIITQVESVDEQWIMGLVGGKRGIVPKNYISLL